MILVVQYVKYQMVASSYPSEVGLLLAGEDLEGGGLADAVGPHQPQHHAGTRNRQPVQLEAVGGISVKKGLVCCERYL